MRRSQHEKMNTSIDFIKQVASISAMECFGVVGMARKNSTDNILDILKKENLNKGVRVYLTKENKLIIDLYVIIEFGVKVMAVAENLMDTVKYNVERQTDLKVKKINVYVQSVRA